MERANALRTLDGNGTLKTSEGNLLPLNVDGLANAGGNSVNLFVAGDVRANEQVGLTIMNTLFVCEHNRLAVMLRDRHPQWTGEQIYQKARQLVGAAMQIITYSEYLPVLLGPGALSRYRGYREDVNAAIANSFSTAAYRYGHSALSETLLGLEEFGQENLHGNLSLRDAFFNPGALIEEGGIEPILRGLAAQTCQTVDARVIDDVRNFLFGPPGAGGFDLVTLNIQRGRDHGLPSYNDAREAMGFERAFGYEDISSDFETQARLASIYDSPDDIDLWVGGLSEDPVPGAHVGLLFHAMVSEQFEALRDGDRYWYSLKLNEKERRMVEHLRLSDIIRLNTEINDELPDDVFRTDQQRRSESRRQRRSRR